MPEPEIRTPAVIAENESYPLDAAIEALPRTLLAVLERRYLDEFDKREWQLESADITRHRPTLLEITRLGRHQPGSGPSRGIPSLLTSCAMPGHALVLNVKSEAERQRLFVGVRRLPAAIGSTADQLEHVIGAFRTSLPGIEFDQTSTRAPNVDDLDDLANFAVVTGIPSRAHGVDLLPNLDSVLRAARGARFQLTIIAEPLYRAELDQALDGLHQIRSEIHSLVRMTESTGRGQTEGGGTSRAEKAEVPSFELRPGYLIGLGVLMQSVAAAATLPTLGQLAGPLQAFAYVAATMAHSNPPATNQTSWSQTVQTGLSKERLNAAAEACEKIVVEHLERLQSAAAGGFWRVAIYIAAANERDLRKVEGALRGHLTGRLSHLDPIRTVEPPADLVRDCMRHGRMMMLTPLSNGPAPPAISTSFDQLATCLASGEAAHLFALPESELPGLPVRNRTVFALTPPPEGSDTIVLGRVQDQDGRPLAMLPIRSATLNRNALVVGLVGSGKTTTCKRILTAAYDHLEVPFLVIEPVKTEYRDIASYPSLRGRLSVFSVGSDAAMPLRLNPLEPVPGFPVARHLDLLKAVFNAAFPMFAGMSYVLEEALVEVYSERGWSLRDEDAMATDLCRNPAERAALLPDLRVLHDRLEQVLDRKGYGKEIHANLGAALRSRLNSLLVGQKALLLDVRRSTPAALIFSGPAIVELHRLGDDEEKAFVMALLFVLLCEHAEVRQADLPASRRGRLQHLTLIEEAHRLLTAPRGARNEESGDPRGKAVQMFTDLLAELRAYGEGFIVADQIPTKLAPDILKNTALKITHRLTAPDDRRAMGGACNLNDEQIYALNLLQPGEAVVHDADIVDALCVKIMPAAMAAGHEAPAASRASDREWLRFGGGCELCMDPCRWRTGLSTDEVGAAAEHALQGLVSALLAGRHVELQIPSNIDEPTGRLFCAGLFALRHQFEEILTMRNEALEGKGLRVQDRIDIERSLSAAAPMLGLWSNGELPHTDSWFELAAILRSLLASRPPRPRPGCASCPSVCSALSEIGEALPKLRTKLSALVKGPQPAALRASTFAEELKKLAGNELRDPQQIRAWQHCVAVVLGGSQPSVAVSELIKELISQS